MNPMQKKEGAKMKHQEFPDEFTRLATLGLFTRQFEFRATSFDEKTRSFEGIFATENKVKVFDWERFDVIDEYLMVDGFIFPEKIPFLDNHRRDGIETLLGSATGMKIEKNGGNNIFIGRTYFGRSEQAENAFIMARDGHINSLSIGYIPTGVWVESGNEYEYKGRKFAGPCKVALQTEVKEVSLTPVGADSVAKYRTAFQYVRDSSIGDQANMIEDLKRKLNEANQAIKLLSL